MIKYSNVKTKVDCECDKEKRKSGWGKWMNSGSDHSVGDEGVLAWKGRNTNVGRESDEGQVFVEMGMSFVREENEC